LRGNLSASKQLESPGEKTRDIPAPGEVWADKSLLEALELNIGISSCSATRNYA